MYHIKPDKRSRSSAEAIVRGYLSCLKTTPMNAVTVTDIHKASGISRATFYRLFDTPEDVLLYQFDQIITMSENSPLPDTCLSAREILEHTISFGNAHRAFLTALLENGRFDLLYLYTEKTFRANAYLSALIPADIEASEREYIFTQLSLTMIGSLITGLKTGRPTSPEQTAAWLSKYIQIMASFLL